MTDPQLMLRRLREGNQRFVDGRAATSLGHRFIPMADQYPEAVILGCADSRVPAEIIFDQGPGDLFVIRVAGNIVAPSQSASVEFAVTRFGTRLVVVLGHSRCGAVLATLEALKGGDSSDSTHMHSIVDRIKPSIHAVLRLGTQLGEDALISEAIRANIRASVQQLTHSSTRIEELVRSGNLQIVGANYCLATGRVEFLDLEN
jgi:carbonic anhydrase